MRPLLAACMLLATALRAADFDVRAHGAKGDGTTLDTAAINAAIAAASAGGGGTVRFPAGTYLSFSLRLQSHITLQLDAGSTLLAATPAAGFGGYDAAEPNASDTFQDFGHSHWHNSLIWGDGLEDIAITGPGRIDGRGLTRRGPPPRGARREGDRPPGLLAPGSRPAGPPPPGGFQNFNMDGQGNKALGLRLCRNVILRDFSLLNGGHFALLATGVDNLTLDNLKVDTNRDGFDLDACRNVRISNCSVNSPNDDAIVLKSSLALGVARSCENITITNCLVSGYDGGSLLAGTFLRTQELAPDRDGVTGRIKIGTESNGDFRNITISNCVFDRCRGLALESVDGGVIEDVTITNLTMRDIVTAPIFIRLGHRARGPIGTPVGAIRRVKISHVTVANADSRYACLITGLPGHPVEDVRLSDLLLAFQGGGTKADAALEPPEHAERYPEPSMFGNIPAAAFFIRHAAGISLDRITVSFAREDQRPPIVLHDVAGADFDQVRAPRTAGVPFFVLRDVKDFSARAIPALADTHRVLVAQESL